MRQASAEKLVALIVRDIDSLFKDRLPAWSNLNLKVRLIYIKSVL